MNFPGQTGRLRRGDRVDQARIVIPDIADARADRPADHALGRVGAQQRLESRQVGRFLAEPCRLNEATGLPRVLRSLAALEPPPAEVLAVGGGSTDASVAIAEAAGLLVVRHETRGRAAAINRGVQEAA